MGLLSIVKGVRWISLSSQVAGRTSLGSHHSRMAARLPCSGGGQLLQGRGGVQWKSLNARRHARAGIVCHRSLEGLHRHLWDRWHRCRTLFPSVVACCSPERLGVALAERFGVHHRDGPSAGWGEGRRTVSVPFRNRTNGLQARYLIVPRRAPSSAATCCVSNAWARQRGMARSGAHPMGVVPGRFWRPGHSHSQGS